jgi:arsenite methyltransferase
VGRDQLGAFADRVEVHTGDMTALPFAGDRLWTKRFECCGSGGRLAIADLWETRQHAARLRELGWRNVKRRNLGWRMWFGGPWFSTRLITATKPG